ncbi:MAG TPA: VOC family protein [Gammaproteobacteria bacterium]|nr:VOC family protein [Gammaproteobacteria bacterium]
MGADETMRVDRKWDSCEAVPRAPVASTSRRAVLGAALGIAASQVGAGRALAQAAPSADLIARQLPLDAVGLEHIGTVVPDVTAAAEFFGRVFNPFVFKEQQPPLRYYVTLDPGYIAIGSRDGENEAFIDHDCVMAESYDRAAMAARLEQEGLPAGRFGIMRDADNLGLQLLPIGGLAGSTEPAGDIVAEPPLLRPRGIYRVVRRVSDLDAARDFYRRFFGQPIDGGSASSAVWFAAGPTLFGLEQAVADETPRIDRFCVNVSRGGYDAGAVAEALTALGATVLDDGDTEIMHFRSPEGIGVELRPVDPARMWGRT